MSSSRTAGRVFIVGGGPGDPELLTIKAARLISEADAILFDKLVNPRCLELARPGCELLYVGKEPGKPCRSQDEINALLVSRARKHDRVVRLKGGDPMVFGRGSEEALALAAAEIDFELVPGISSSIAAPQYAGIPLTHRGVACSYAVITGHETSEKDEPQVDWGAFTRVDTLVVLMGVGRRQEIAQALLAAGRPPEDRVAFVENGSTPRQRTVTTTLRDLADRPPEVASPAVMIIGKVVELGAKISWFQGSAISNDRTRPATGTPAAP